MDAYTPAQTTELISRAGAKKAKMPADKLFINAFMGGALISVRLHPRLSSMRPENLE